MKRGLALSPDLLEANCLQPVVLVSRLRADGGTELDTGQSQGTSQSIEAKPCYLNTEGGHGIDGVNCRLRSNQARTSQTCVADRTVQSGTTGSLNSTSAGPCAMRFVEDNGGGAGLQRNYSTTMLAQANNTKWSYPTRHRYRMNGVVSSKAAKLRARHGKRQARVFPMKTHITRRIHRCLYGDSNTTMNTVVASSGFGSKMEVRKNEISDGPIADSASKIFSTEAQSMVSANPGHSDGRRGSHTSRKTTRSARRYATLRTYATEFEGISPENNDYSVSLGTATSPRSSIHYDSSGTTEGQRAGKRSRRSYPALKTYLTRRAYSTVFGDNFYSLPEAESDSKTEVSMAIQASHRGETKLRTKGIGRKSYYPMKSYITRRAYATVYGERGNSSCAGNTESRAISNTKSKRCARRPYLPLKSYLTRKAYSTVYGNYYFPTSSSASPATNTTATAQGKRRRRRLYSPMKSYLTRKAYAMVYGDSPHDDHCPSGVSASGFPDKVDKDRVNVSSESQSSEVGGACGELDSQAGVVRTGASSSVTFPLTSVTMPLSKTIPRKSNSTPTKKRMLQNGDVGKSKKTRKSGPTTSSRASNERRFAAIKCPGSGKNTVNLDSRCSAQNPMVVGPLVVFGGKLPSVNLFKLQATSRLSQTRTTKNVKSGRAATCSRRK